MSTGVGKNLYLNQRLRATVRAYVTKMPYFYFSGFPQIAFFGNALTGYDDYMGIIEDNIWS